MKYHTPCASPFCRQDAGGTLHGVFGILPELFDSTTVLERQTPFCSMREFEFGGTVRFG